MPVTLKTSPTETGISDSSDSSTNTYTYNDSGIRTSKTVNGVTTNYFLNGDQVVRESNGTDTLDYFYDGNSDLFAFNYNGTGYYYVRNGQNDIIGILDTSGTQVVSYSYDSWGKLLSTTGSLASTVGVKNPYRYRGYRYDSETGLYYVTSRYYDPQICRFINADDTDVLSASPTELTDKNIFAYCDNNPVVRADDDGEFWHVVAGAVIGGLVGGAIKAFSNVASGKGALDGVGSAFIGGAVFGGIMAGTGNLIAASYASAATEAACSEVYSYASKKKKLTGSNVLGSLRKVAIDTAIDGTVTLITGKIAGKAVKINKGWIKPQKLVSSFTGRYAQKVWGQTAFQGLQLGVYQFNKNNFFSSIQPTNPFQSLLSAR